MKRPLSSAPLPILLLLTACGSGGASPQDGSGLPGVTPRPLDVRVTLQAEAAVSRTVPLDGGTLELTYRDTGYTLTIPANALLAETEITMTPIAALEGAPVEGGTLAGVELAPEGLRLHQPATLTITPPGGPAASAAAFAYRAGGTEFHGYPLALDPEVLRLELLHFSGHLVYYGDGIHIPVEPASFMPSDWESQLEHMAQELIRSEREAQLRGEAGDPQFAEKLEALLNTFYVEIVAPLLPSIRAECRVAETHASKVLAWTRQTHLFGFGEVFAEQNEQVWDSLVAGLKNCWQETVEPCLDTSDPAQMSEASRIARQLQLLGESAEVYNPLDPELVCSDCGDLGGTTEWAGSFSYSFDQTASDGDYTVQVRRLADATFTLGNRRELSDGAVRWQYGTVTGGTSSIYDSWWPSGSNPATWTGSGTPDAAYITLILEEDGEGQCRYQLRVNNSHTARHNVSGVEATGFPIEFLVEGRPQGGGLSGNRSLTSEYRFGTPIEAGFFRFYAGYARQLDEVTGGSFEEAQATWSLSPVKP